MISFNDLVDDVILLIPQHLSESDLNSLSRASKRLHVLLDPVLYTQHVRSHGTSALTWAAETDNASLVRRLQALGADITSLFDDESLHFLAALHGAVEVTKLLIETEGADPALPTRYEASAIFIAARGGHAEVVALHLADSRLDSSIVNGGALDALEEAVEEAHPRVLEVFLRDARIDLGAESVAGRTFLHDAACSSEPNVECIQMLLANPHVDRFRLDCDGNSVLHIALSYGDAENFRPLLDAGLDPNQQNYFGKTPFAYAAERLDLEPCVELLRVPGVDVNVQDMEGNTPLMAAVRRASVEVVAALVADARVLPNLTRRDGMTALMIACRKYGKRDAVEVLLQRADLDLTLTDREGRTALHIAIQTRRYEIIQMLCKKGSPAAMAAAGARNPVDRTDREGRNAMSYAAAEAPDGVIKILLEIEREVKGIDWMQFDRRGRDAAWYAKMNGRHDIAELLEEGRDLGARKRPSISSSECSGPICTLVVSESD